MRRTHQLASLLLAAFLLISAISAGAEAPEAAEQLTINVADLKDEPAFIDWIQDDIPMQLIALKDSDGRTRLAFNTCQTCNGSPWAWFEYLGNGELECQNCRQRVSSGMVGIEEAKGCVPIPVIGFTENDDGAITVPEQVLTEAVRFFTNWRKTGK